MPRFTIYIPEGPAVGWEEEKSFIKIILLSTSDVLLWPTLDQAPDRCITRLDGGGYDGGPGDLRVTG